MLHESALPAALKAFEYALEDPVIPGELQSWSEIARDACSDAVAALNHCIPIRHEQLLNEISQQAPEMSARVQQLRRTDSELLQQGRQLLVDAETLVVNAALVASRESKVSLEVEMFVDAGLAWIIRARKQEAAITVWFQEAFNRDRGIGD